MWRRVAVVVSVLLSTGLPFGNTAYADAIDGSWCAADGRKLTIEGPKIVTPTGIVLTGNNDRDGFTYTVPSAELGAGSTIVMILVDDDTVNVTIRSPQGAEGPLEVWFRCSQPT